MGRACHYLHLKSSRKEHTPYFEFMLTAEHHTRLGGTEAFEGGAGECGMPMSLEVCLLPTCFMRRLVVPCAGAEKVAAAIPQPRHEGDP